MSFSAFGLCKQLLSVIVEKGYNTPTKIQNEAIPAILAGRDVIAAAQTGTGKTAAFALPILERLANHGHVKSNHVRALVLVPTRELAAQVGENITRYARQLPLRINVVYGGVKINPQMIALCKGSDIVVATPGRLLDLYQHNAIKFVQLQTLVLDEADRMLELGFSNELKKIIALLPKQHQTLMFSATISPSIQALATGIVKQALKISINPNEKTANTIEHYLYPVDEKRKSALLKRLIKQNQWQQVLVFCKTKQGCDQVVRYLGKNTINACAIHGDKSQSARTRALEQFKQGEVAVLVATDLAARGLDIYHLPQVVNYDLPHITEDYVHRIGRTGRAGIKGEAVSLVCADEFTTLCEIERLIRALIPRKSIDGFEPSITLPKSRLDTRPIKPKKPKKSKKPSSAQ